ncbi:uncharacterized protein [Drosophila takahashii]|uniref:uncharacterized protein n=1 Tax=Drosophila takahashii TaxID=29030 RepID=UPI003898E3AE
MSLLKPPNPVGHPPPHPPPQQMQRLPFLGSCEPLAEAEMDSDSEQERPNLHDDEDAAIDVEADEEQESESTASKGSLSCLESKENPGQHKELAAPGADKTANQKAY